MRITHVLKRSLVLAVALAGMTVQAATVMVFAAASLTDGLKEIARDYEAKTGERIEFNFAASSVLARQIEEGAPADIFFSADEAKMDALAAKDLVNKNTRHRRLSNSLVIIVPKESTFLIRSPEDLKSPQITHIALGEPGSVPAGIYAKEYLRKVHLWHDLKPKIVPMANVRAALAAVESGDADAGIVYKTDALISKTSRIAFAVPPRDSPKISYPVALMKGAPNAKAAQAFLNHLESGAAGRVFEKFGFTVNRPGP